MSSSGKQMILGFGFSPDESLHHFLVTIPVKEDSMVTVYERFSWQSGARKQKINVYDDDKPKAEISKHKWKLLVEAMQTEFNKRLKIEKKPSGKFVTQTPLGQLYGKEMLVLVWSVQDCDPSVVDIAVRNWLGLAPEERWWLYTMTNAATGGLNDNRGWRKALRYALTENPVEESRQCSIHDIEMFIRKSANE